jgi:hypothetical protein
VTRSGAAFPRARFERVLRADSAVSAALYTGSIASGAADAFSDIDVELVFAPDCADGRGRVEALCGALGRLQFGYWRDRLFTAFFGAGWQRVDLRLLCERELRPGPRFAAARVVVDREGRAAQVVASSRPDASGAAPADAREELACAIDTQIYAALHIARGALWSAQGELTHRAQRLYALLARLRGHEVFGFRAVEAVLDRHERALLERAWPRAPRTPELRRATRALWRFTELVRERVGTALGDDAVPRVDARALLRAVERIRA